MITIKIPSYIHGNAVINVGGANFIKENIFSPVTRSCNSVVPLCHIPGSRSGEMGDKHLS